METHRQLADGTVPDRWKDGVNNEVMEIKHVSEKGAEFIAKEEGLELEPYLDVAGIPTIGIGATFWEDGTRVKMSDKPITRERAFKLFRYHLDLFEKTVWSVTRDDINQNQFDSLVSITLNIGIGGFKGSTLLKKVNANPNDPGITKAFEMWQNSGKKKGVLLARRKREAALYFS